MCEKTAYRDILTDKSCSLVFVWYRPHQMSPHHHFNGIGSENEICDEKITIPMNTETYTAFWSFHDNSSGVQIFFFMKGMGLCKMIVL